MSPMSRRRAAAAATTILPVLAALALAAAACGGGTPKPKDEDDTASAKSKGDDSTAGSSAPSDSAAPADSSPPATPPAASTASSGTGDIKATGDDDPWMASHQMTPKDVMKTMGPVKGRVQACFKAGLKRDGSTNGEVKLRFVITNAGVVRVWKDNASSMSDGDVTQCVGELLNKLKFPKQKSPGDAWGAYSINFTP